MSKHIGNRTKYKYNTLMRPQMNNTIKSMDYNWTPGPDQPNNQDAGAPRAIFIPHSNSLPFDERRVTLEQPVKVSLSIL